MKKDKQSTPKKEKKISKQAIIIAWIVLIILIILAVVLTYLKFFGPNENLEEHSVNDANNQIDTQTELLESITTNFNDSSLVEEYLNQDINVWANVNSNNNSIMLNYETTDIMQYELTYSEPTLEISITKEGEVVFSELFKVLILANQERLENSITNTEYIDEFLKGNSTIDGYTREVTGEDIKYTMDITKKINTEGNTTSETTQNTTPETAQNTTPETNNIEGSE